MLLSPMAMKPTPNCSLETLPQTRFMFPIQPPRESIFVKSSFFPSPVRISCSPTTKIRHFAYSAAAAAEALDQESIANDNSASSAPLESEKLGVLVKPMEKPRLVLKFIWMEKNIGLALDQLIPGHGSIPLSPYYFWPRKDAWEELKVMLEGKPWISQKQVVILLNQATDIINLWQQSGGDLV